MGLLSRLKPSRPNLSTKPITVYRATIRTDEGTHIFVYLVDPSEERPMIISNPVGFQMPFNPTFMQAQKLTTEFQGRKIPVCDIEPIDSRPLPGDEKIRVEIPDSFKGVWIPETDNQSEFEALIA